MRLCRLRQVNPNSRLSVPVNNILILSRLLVTGRETISKFHTETIPRPRNASATSAFRDRELATRPLDNRIAFYPLNWKLWLFPGARGEVRREREGEINFVTGSRCRERERERVETEEEKGREGKKVRGGKWGGELEGKRWQGERIEAMCMRLIDNHRQVVSSRKGCGGYICEVSSERVYETAIHHLSAVQIRNCSAISSGYACGYNRD